VVSPASLLGSRVTKLGDFSPIGQLFIMGSFLKMTEVAQNFVNYFFPQQKFMF
jgi:hypothetical protein